MRQRHVPGGAVAIVKDGRLVYARGYGFADVEQHTPVEPNSMFRIASISKPITSAAIMTLVQNPAHHLSLDAKAFELLDMKAVLPPDTQADPRLWEITIRQLLHHTGGFDKGKSGDPMFKNNEIAQALHVSAPADAQAIVRYMISRPLDFEPGTKEVYSNFGYCVLGRIIEKVSGERYDAYVRKALLNPMGITHMRLGRTAPQDRAKNEVQYYQRGPAPDYAPALVTGGFYVEPMDSHGGWLASAVELARFAAMLDVPPEPPILNAASLKELYAPPPPPVSCDANGKLNASFYACGWNVRPVGRDGKANIWHNGSLPGTATLLVRRWDGLTWAVLFNQRSNDKALPDGAIDGAMHAALDAVKEWSKRDLFPLYMGAAVKPR
jgi:N-acyl-D-amino-acid deacylase